MKAGVAHLFGDYLLQSDWMATYKTRESGPCLAHAATYVIPFLTITRSPRKLLLIGGMHYLIDRYRVARYFVWAKNQLAPAAGRYSMEEAGGTGYSKSRDAFQPWMSTWLLIIADNALHLAWNDWVLGES